MDFELVVYDLYDMIIDFLESKNFLEKCFVLRKSAVWSGFQKQLQIL